MAFLGMRGTDDWATDERPKNWRQGILRLYPNGSAPLTGMLSKMSEESTDDPEFNWWTKLLAGQTGVITGVYSNSGLSVAYVSGGVAGTVLYIKMSAAHASEFKATHQVLLRDSTDLLVDVVGKVLSVVVNGSSSYIVVRLLEADNNSLTHDLSNADTALIIGSINPEGGPMPDAVAYDPDKNFNFTQIFRTSLSITRTARKTRLRTEDAYKEAKREALELHSIEMEKAFFWSIRTENTGANGKPERTTMGVVEAIRTGAPENVVNFTTDPLYAGDTWLAGGEDWLDSNLERIFRYGSNEKFVFGGSGAILGINRLVKNVGLTSITSSTVAYGIKVLQWITPFGTIYMKTHPLFSYDATTRKSLIIVEPDMLKYRYIDDTMFKGDDGLHGRERVDGTDEEWITECGLEFHHPRKFGYLSGIGDDNTL